MSLVWGRITSGSAANAIPARGEAEGTLRCLDVNAWRLAAELIPSLASQLVAPYGVEVDTEVTHGVPPVMNDAAAIDVLHNAVHQTLGSGAIAPTDQSLGGEDFAWYLEDIPGAMARLGVRPPAQETAADLHTPGFDPSEEAISLGTTVLTTAALLD
jgi:amidohydrolase